MENQKYNVESFNLDHTKVTAPYVRQASKKVGTKGDIVSKYDIRFCQPNEEFMPIASIHTLEHLVAEYIRNVLDGIIDFSPMGCRTGFYLTIFDEHTEEEIAQKMLVVLKQVASWPDEKEIPGRDPKECGNYKEHDLQTAKSLAKKWVDGIEATGFNCYK
ncbi:MAG: S-ribosylhomocysteine lyase [Treponemataceae bacterium]|jgi:S-ribosylhomocysteine lyase|nr:S-ribosylhomocysteine lyase [Treponemataceae bacterium]